MFPLTLLTTLIAPVMFHGGVFRYRTEAAGDCVVLIAPRKNRFRRLPRVSAATHGQFWPGRHGTVEKRKKRRSTPHGLTLFVFGKKDFDGPVSHMHIQMPKAFVRSLVQAMLNDNPRTRSDNRRNVGYQTGVRNMRHLILATSIATSMLLYAAVPAHAQVSVGIQSHGVSIGFNVSAYPRMVAIPGYPVYYDPRMSSNYFFYDGLYWVVPGQQLVFERLVRWPVGPDRAAVCARVRAARSGSLLRPAASLFCRLERGCCPALGEYWGNDWQQQRSGWDSLGSSIRLSSRAVAGLSAQYSGSRYPRAVDQQYSIQATNYRYHPARQ
jgi:hypothetical protein